MMTGKKKFVSFWLDEELWKKLEDYRWTNKISRSLALKKILIKELYK